MKKYIYLTLIAGCLVGCTDAKLQFDQASMQKLIGQPETEVVRQLGQPDKNIVKGNTTYLVYATTYENYTPPTAQPYLNPGQLPEVGVPGIMGYYTPETCVTTFEIQQSIVQNVHTMGNCL